MTSGPVRRPDILAWLTFAAIGGVFAVINATSVLADRARLGHAVETWKPWCWELTSYAAWLTLAPLILTAAVRLRSQRFSWSGMIGLHVLLSIAASLIHSALMTVMRHLIYAAAGNAYLPGALGEVLLYEYRKDLIPYAALAFLPFIVQRLLNGRGEVEEGACRNQLRIEVRNGTRTVWLAPADIEWAQAAGNYVELYGDFGTLLHRQTLAGLENELDPHGFRRIHRSRIVRADAVRSIRTRPSGDFEVTLTSGAQVLGSRRLRGRLG